MVLCVGKTLRKFGEWYIFDLLTLETLTNIETEIKSFLKQIKQRGGLRDFKVSVTSSEYEMKRKIATANVEILPTYVLEKLLFNISLTA
jgi:phage tail sheath protein FI